MNIVIKNKEVYDEVELLSSYRGAKGSEDGRDYDRLRTLRGLDDTLLRSFMADGSALLSLTAGCYIGALCQGEDCVSIVVCLTEPSEQELKDKVENIIRSFYKLYVLSRWYGMFGLEESVPIKEEAEKMALKVPGLVSAAVRTRYGVIARRRPLPPF